MNQTVSFSQQIRKELFNSFLQKSLYQIKTDNRQEIPAALLICLLAEKRVLNGIFVKWGVAAFHRRASLFLGSFLSPLVSVL